MSTLTTPPRHIPLASSERRLTEVPWEALRGLGPLLEAPLEAVLQGHPAERVLDRFLRAHRDFSPAQRTACAEALFGVGLWRRRLHWHLGGASALQMLVILARELGQYAEAERALGVTLPQIETAVPEDWKTRFSFPDWIAEHLEARFGPTTAALADAFNSPGPVCLRARGSRVELQQMLADRGIGTELGRWAPHALRVTTTRPNLLGLGPEFQGQFEVQDEGSQLIGELVSAQPGDEVLDVCAGAGGKTLQLAVQVGPSGRVHATDVDLSRLQRLRTRALKANAVISIHGAMPPENLQVSRVLIDAPCSELGVLRRGPDVRWRLQPSPFAPLQRELIHRGLRHLTPGGRLVYATCTLTRAENEAVVEGILSEHPTLRLVRPSLPDAVLDSQGLLQLSPHLHGTDGFFGAVFIRGK